MKRPLTTTTTTTTTSQVTGTIWLELNEETAHKSLEHKAIEEQFSAFQRKEV
jgi:hypothetical protein